MPPDGSGQSPQNSARHVQPGEARLTSPAPRRLPSHPAATPITRYDGAVTERAGDGLMTGPQDRVAEQGQSPESPRPRESDRVDAQLRERLERLPPSHPSSPYNDDGSRKPPPPDLSAYELPIPGDPDYRSDDLSTSETGHIREASDGDIHDYGSPVARDDYLDQELPPPDQGETGNQDSREREERLSQITDQAMGSCRDAEGRDADGSYGERGLTPAMRRIESQLEHGHLADKTEEYALKSPERFKEKLAERVGRFPNADPSDLAAEIHDGVRYTFIFDLDQYTESVDLTHS